MFKLVKLQENYYISLTFCSEQHKPELYIKNCERNKIDWVSL